MLNECDSENNHMDKFAVPLKVKYKHLLRLPTPTLISMDSSSDNHMAVTDAGMSS